jgi:hypothetical protein
MGIITGSFIKDGLPNPNLNLNFYYQCNKCYREGRNNAYIKVGRKWFVYEGHWKEIKNNYPFTRATFIFR